jgi:hypothetical protein
VCSPESPEIASPPEQMGFADGTSRVSPPCSVGGLEPSRESLRTPWEARHRYFTSRIHKKRLETVHVQNKHVPRVFLHLAVLVEA